MLIHFLRKNGGKLEDGKYAIGKIAKKMPTLTDFQKRLKELLDEKHLSQVDFAKKINVQKSTINGYILGYRSPSIETLILMAKELNVSIDFLIGLSNVRKNIAELNDEEIQIIDAYRNFGSEGKSILRNISKTNQ